MRHAERGFTLMELMVVIVIIGILAAVAVPLYINYVKDAQRAEAKGAIGAVVTAEQTYYQQYNTYVDDKFIPNPGDPANAGKQKLNCDLTDALHNWSISVTATDPANSFVVTANSIADPGLTQKFTFIRGGETTWEPK